MTASEDVKTLFRRFGGEPDSYQEVAKERAVGQALGKWAMLGQVDLHNPQSVSSVRRAVKTADTRPLTEGANIEIPVPTTRQAATVAEVIVAPQPEVAPQPPATVIEPQLEHLATVSRGLTPLAARLRAQTVQAQPEPEAADSRSHSLPGLFNRLSKPTTPAPQPGVLRRKFNK